MQVPQQKALFPLATLVRDVNTTDTVPETAVKYHKLQWYTQQRSGADSMIARNELPETYLLSNCKEQNESTSCSPPKAYSKLAEVSQTLAHDAASFLSGRYQRSLSRKKKSVVDRSEILDVYPEDALLMLSRNDSADSTFKPSQYHAFKFLLPRTKLRDATTPSGSQAYQQFLMIRQPGLQRSGPMSLSKDLGSFEAFDTVEICTGMCLFSEEDLGLCTMDGTIQPKQLAQLPVSICEKEIIARLSTTIANTASLYIHGRNVERSPPLRINIDIPSVQYYMDALTAFENGACGSEDVLAWMTAIKNRRLLLFRTFSKAIEYGLRERGLLGDDVQIVLSRGLKAVGETIFCKLRYLPNRLNWIQEIMSAIIHDGDESWVEFLGLLSDNEQTPNTWRQFHTLSYVYEVVKPVLRARSTMQSSLRATSDPNTGKTICSETNSRATKSAPPSPPPNYLAQKDYFDSATTPQSQRLPRILLLAIDDSDEGRIYTKAYQALCKLSTSAARSPGSQSVQPPPIIARILTISPAPQILVGAPAVKEKSWSRPSLWRAPLRSDRTVGSCLQFRTEEGLVVTDSDVLKIVYDEQLISQLERWLQDK